MPQYPVKLNRVKHVAELFGLHPLSVYDLIRRGEIKATRIGRAVMSAVSVTMPRVTTRNPR